MSSPLRVIDAPEPASASFADLGVTPALVGALARAGVVAPFPIQTSAIPDALAGRDVLGRGKTGSGKTIAFGIPVVEALAALDAHSSPGRPHALVLVPTRELAAQVEQTLRLLARAAGLHTATIFGGVPQGAQVAALRRGSDIVVATPGRLEDLIAQGHCRLGDVRVTVLDEADHMADLGFLPVVKRILDQTPADGQRLLFSATLDNAVDALVKRYLRNPVVHSVDPVDSSPELLEHHVFTVETGHKASVVTELASGLGRSLLFTRTKHGAKKLARQLSLNGIPALELHGNLSQNVRQRNLAAFAAGTSRVLVATDIAARGIHVDDIALVVHVDPPSEHKAFLHRSGRTARAGAAGAVITLATPDQQRDVQKMVRQAGIVAASSRVAPGDPATQRLAGPPAERRAFTPPKEEAPQRRPKSTGFGAAKPTRRGSPSGRGAQRPSRTDAGTGRAKPTGAAPRREGSAAPRAEGSAAPRREGPPTPRRDGSAPGARPRRNRRRPTPR